MPGVVCLIGDRACIGQGVCHDIYTKWKIYHTTELDISVAKGPIRDSLVYYYAQEVVTRNKIFGFITDEAAHRTSRHGFVMNEKMTTFIVGDAGATYQK